MHTGKAMCSENSQCFCVVWDELTSNWTSSNSIFIKETEDNVICKIDKLGLLTVLYSGNPLIS